MNSKGNTMPGDLEGEVTISSGEYFVLGDNRGNSEDSRATRIGVVKKEEIIGVMKRKF